MTSPSDEAPVDHLLSRTNHIERYRLDDRETFNDFVQAFDVVENTRTWFCRLNLEEINRLDNRRTDDHVQLRISSLVDNFLPQDGTIILGRETAHDWVKPEHDYHRVMQRIKVARSLNRLQKQQRFTTPMSAMFLPNGLQVVDPGTTRRMFAGSRPDLIDVMLTDYRPYGNPGRRWTHCQDFELMKYEGTEMVTRTFIDSWAKKFRYENPVRSFKIFKDASIHNDYTIMDDDSTTFEMARRSDTVYINGEPLCRKRDGLWKMVPYV